MTKNDLVWYQNNSVIAVALRSQAEKFIAGEIERHEIGIAVFLPASFLKGGNASVREQGASGTIDDLDKLMERTRWNEKNIFVPFSNAGMAGSGWASDLREMGEASAHLFHRLFGQDAQSYKFRAMPKAFRLPEGWDAV